ncbi:amino acid transporter, putative [Plasmodium malariae]|uniref:Amino acid transporter, putative n=1 Tax=Plasmodium malariae TaxID=5858 RepID=A0A1A8W8U3_PLAMA|nr:amino acid transporter, putative [Plasmodium malariae]
MTVKDVTFYQNHLNEEKNTEYHKLKLLEEDTENIYNEYENSKRYDHKKAYIEKVKRLKEKKYFGNKTIGKKSSYIYLINQIFGSGIVSIPYIFKSSGWLPCLIANVGICLLTIFNTILFLRAMTMIPNNIHFNKRYEYISTVCYFLGKNNIFFWCMQVCYYASILGSNIISIIIVSHAVDNIIINIFGYTVGIVMYPNFQLNFFTDVNELYYNKNYILCLTVGYLINASISIYFSQSNLEDNMKIQLISFLFLMSTIFQMMFLSGLKLYRYSNTNIGISNNGIKKYAGIKYPTAFGDFNFKQLLSSYISAYSAVTVIPCWANEMKSDVKIIKTVWLSNFFCCFIYYIFGYILCTAYPNINSDNILYDILQNPFINNYMKVTIYLFDLLTIAPACKNIPYSEKNPLQHTHVLYDPKEYKKKKSLYNIFYSKIAIKEKDTEHYNPLDLNIKNKDGEKEQIKEEQEIGEQNGIIKKFQVQRNYSPTEEQENIELKLDRAKLPHKSHHATFLKNNSIHTSNTRKIRKSDEHNIINSINCSNDINVSTEKMSSFITAVDNKVNGTMTIQDNDIIENGNVNSRVRISEDEKEKNLSNYLEEEKSKNIIPLGNVSNKHIDENRKESNWDNTCENYVVPISKGLITEFEIEEKGIIEKVENHEPNINKKKLGENETNGSLPIHDLFEEEENNNYNSKDDIEKGRKMSGKCYNGKKSKTDKLEFRKFNSLFNMKSKNISEKDSKEKHKLSNNIRRSRKHKTVMGFEKNKKDKKVSIQDGQTFSQSSDSSDNDILYDKIIADLSRNIYNDIKIVKESYERDEYLINYSDIFDSFLNLKLILESNYNGKNTIYNFYNSCITNKTHFNKTIKESNNVMHNSFNTSTFPNNYYLNNVTTEIPHSVGITIKEKKMASQENSEEHDTVLQTKDLQEFTEPKRNKMNEQKYEEMGRTYGVNTIMDNCPLSSREEKKKELDGVEEDEEKEEGAVINLSDDIYERNISELEKKFHMFINGINNKQNFTWNFDGNKNKNKLGKVINNKNINVSNVQNIFQPNDITNSYYERSKSENYFRALSLCKKGLHYDVQSDKFNTMHILKSSKSCGNSLLNYRSTDTNIINDFIQTKSVDYSRKFKHVPLESSENIFNYFIPNDDAGLGKKPKKGIKNIITDTQAPLEMVASNENENENENEHIYTENALITNTNSSEFDITKYFFKNGHDMFPLIDENKLAVNKEKIKNFKTEDSVCVNKNNIQSEDKNFMHINSYNKKIKMYKDVNTLAVPDNVYNVIPKINKVSGGNNVDDTINNIFNYYKYNFLLSFSEKHNNNKKKRDFNKHINIRNEYFLQNSINRESNNVNGSYAVNSENEINGTHCENNEVNYYNVEDNSDTHIRTKTYSNINSKFHYLRKFQNDEKKEPLLNTHQKVKQYDELPTINLICSEKPLYGYEDAYKIDDYVNGKINENIIHVYPCRYLRIKHVTITKMLLFIAVQLLLISVFYDFIY